MGPGQQTIGSKYAHHRGGRRPHGGDGGLDDDEFELHTRR